MAITSLDAALAGMQEPRLVYKGPTPTMVAGIPQSCWYLNGIPGPGSAAGTTAGGVTLSTTSAQVNGAIYHTDPAANSYLARWSMIAQTAGQLWLCDRLLHCGGTTAGVAISATLTTAQTLNTVALPARDSSGATAGLGVSVAVECAAAMGSGTPTLTVSYTNSAGTSGRSGTNIEGISGVQQGAFYLIGLQAGDVGVQSVQSLTLSATWTSGTINVVLYRIIAVLEVSQAWQPNALDALTSGFPQIFNGSTMFFIFVPSVNTATNFMGTVSETQG